MASCTQEIFPEGNSYGENCIVLNLNSSGMNTKAIDNLMGSDNERLIKRVDCFFFSKDDTTSAYKYYKRINAVNANVTAEIPIYVNEATLNSIFPQGKNTCDVYVIANLPDEITLPGNATLGDLRKLQITSEEFKNIISSGSPESFVMEGKGIAERVNDSASGDIPLRRAASKLSLSIRLPEYIDVLVFDQFGEPIMEDGVQKTERYRPHITITEDPAEPSNTLIDIDDVSVGFHNGVSKTYLHGEYDIASKESFETGDTYSFTYKSTSVDKEGKNQYLFECDVDYYSYYTKWEHGDHEAPFLSLVIPWKKDGDGSYTTYFYQVMINSANKVLMPNNWYDLTLNVGVLGSTVETVPVVLDKLSYYVLNWTTLQTTDEHLEEEVKIFEWQYLMIPETRVEMNNVITGELLYEASHSVKYILEWPTDDAIREGFDALEEYNKGGYAAYYINCSERVPVAKDISTYLAAAFEISADETSLKFTYPEESLKDEKIYSPVYVHLKVWLDVDGQDDEGPSSAVEEEFTEYITFVYYPNMYIIPDPSNVRSVFVNGVKHQNSSDNTGWYIVYNGHSLGNASGLKDSGDNANYSMYTIVVTSFEEEDEDIEPEEMKNRFIGPRLNDAGDITTPIEGNCTTYPFLIGDPRQRDIDIELDNGAAHKMEDYWFGNIKDNTTNNSNTQTETYVIKTDANGNVIRKDGKIQYDSSRSLKYYYPTANVGYSFQVVAPKFKIVSYNSASRSYGTAEGAAMRCATLQEDGYPAGRWRLPTIAEIQYIIKLQNEGAIQKIFTSSSSSYATATSYTNTNNDVVRVTLTSGGNGDTDRDGLTFGEKTDRISVRCVYDEWFWGSAREAKENPEADSTPDNGDEYLFTWGDKEIIW